MIKEGTHGLIEPVSIVIALIIITVVNSANGYDSEIRLRNLLMLNGSGRTVAVYRNGENARTISDQNLVVGDVYEISIGMAVPADSIVLEANGVMCDESTLTGEAE